MVGLSVILESQKRDFGQKSLQVIKKTSVMINANPSPFSSSSSSSTTLCLDFCYLCKQKLLPGKDIYMYKGDKGFCSVECRYRQIFMDEEESIHNDNKCSFAAINTRIFNSSSSSTSSSSSSSSSSSPAVSRNRKSARDRRGEFVH